MVATKAVPEDGLRITWDPVSMRFSVTWVGGTWFITGPQGTEPITGGAPGLDAWLTAHGGTRRELDLGSSNALRQRFLNDFGLVDAPNE
jgi:hypothetical protein